MCYELILPTRYNDGLPVEFGKFLRTKRELVAEFGAASFLPKAIRGTWIREGKAFQDENVRLFVDVEDTQQTAAFFRQYKETLKNRFQQIDIWIVSYEIRVT